MKFLWTNASRNVLKEIKKKMIEQHENKDINRFKLKFTKKKEFLAVPLPHFNIPAFNLFINEEIYGTYLFEKNKWREIL